mmetsp:Transcript_2338/g.3414  ORF Transcript_2338/g.3414 Transcript_2338/m.3414 type:complete len:138 (-) Transcript_2338:281-694(-)
MGVTPVYSIALHSCTLNRLRQRVFYEVLVANIRLLSLMLLMLPEDKAFFLFWGCPDTSFFELVFSSSGSYLHHCMNRFQTMIDISPTRQWSCLQKIELVSGTSCPLDVGTVRESNHVFSYELHNEPICNVHYFFCHK